MAFAFTKVIYMEFLVEADTKNVETMLRDMPRRCQTAMADGMDHATRSFYEEYFAVADLPAEFYLETVKHVFQEYALPRGKLKWRGRKVDPYSAAGAGAITSIRSYAKQYTPQVRRMPCSMEKPP